MKLMSAVIALCCVMLCSCGNSAHSPSAASQNEKETTGISKDFSEEARPSIVTTSAVPTITVPEEPAKEITIPSEFTKDEEWLHCFIQQNFENADFFVQAESDGAIPDIELCVAGSENVKLYGIAGDGPFSNVENYRRSLSEYYSEDIIERFMESVTIARKVKETDEHYYNIEGINGRIYVEMIGQEYDENGEPLLFPGKYVEIDGVMYKDEGMGSHGTWGVYEYSRIVSMTDDEIIFTYPVRESFVIEMNLVSIAEGRLVKEDGIWKFGWYLGSDDLTEKYNDIWYT